MTVRDFYFKFQDAASAAAELGKLGFYRRADGELTHESRDVSIDEIGVIHQPTGEMVVIEGDDVAITAPIDGHHINIRTLDDSIAEQLTAISQQVFPATPVQRWA
ncbi:hypothetical protein ACK39D_05250 [Aeromonas veronii]